MIFDEVVLFAQAPVEDELIAAYYEDEPLVNESRTLTYTGTLASDDILNVNLQSGQHTLYDASGKSESYPGNSVGGDNAFLHGDEDEEAVLYIPNAIDVLRVTGRAHWR